MEVLGEESIQEPRSNSFDVPEKTAVAGTRHLQADLRTRRLDNIMPFETSDDNIASGRVA